MRGIYKAARGVVIWLGDEDNDSEIAIRLIKEMAVACEEGVNHEEGVKLCQSFAAGSWKALGRFFNRQYWDRLWNMQELALGSSATPVL